MLVACNNNGAVSSGSPVASLPPIGWDTSPKAIIFRLDRTLNGETVVNAHNRLPLCTLFGSGHLVWVNPTPPNGEQTLEAQVNIPAFQAFLDFLIKQQHFYSIPDYAADELPPSGQYTIESISLNVNYTPRTVRSYTHWPGNEFQNMLDKCSHLSEQPVLYVPTGAWLEVYPVSGPNADPPILWTGAMPFRLGDVAASAKPVWLSGDLLGRLWRIIHRSLGAVQWIENNDNSNSAYQLALDVPDISRDAPPAPAVTPTPWPALTASPRQPAAGIATSTLAPPTSSPAVTEAG